MTIQTSDITQRRAARVAGAAYLGNYITAVAGVVLMSRIPGGGDFADRAARILASESLYRVALTSMAVSWVVLAVQAYALTVTLDRVHAHLARVAGLLMASQAIVGAVSILFAFMLLRVYAATGTQGALTGEQLASLRVIVNGAYGNGFTLAMLFFSPASLLFFWLFRRSGYLPRPVATLGVAGSMLMIVATIAGLLGLSAERTLTILAWVPMGIAEVVTACILAFRGIRTPAVA